MAYKERVELYNKVEEKRKRPLITYFTSYRPNANAQIASDIISEFITQVNKIPTTSKEVDIIIVSYGGDPMVSYRLMNILRERFDKIGVLIPFAAYSAATLFALGADEIVMHPFSNLGPVDPQLAYKNKDGQITGKLQFGTEDLRNYIAFVKEDVGISDQALLLRAFELVCGEIGSIRIGQAKRSAQLTLSLGEKLLSLHMSDKNKAKTIAEALNKSFYNHGYPLSRTESKDIGLPIKPNKDIEELLWEIFTDIENEMQCSNPFNPLTEVLNDPNAKALLGPVKQVNIPNGLPPQILQQAIQNILSQIAIVEIEPTNYELFLATLESKNFRSECRACGKILSKRQPDNQIVFNVIPVSTGWKFIP